MRFFGGGTLSFTRKSLGSSGLKSNARTPSASWPMDTELKIFSILNVKMKIFSIATINPLFFCFSGSLWCKTRLQHIRRMFAFLYNKKLFCGFLSMNFCNFQLCDPDTSSVLDNSPEKATCIFSSHLLKTKETFQVQICSRLYWVKSSYLKCL